MKKYVPVTPGGSILGDLESMSEELAWGKLMKLLTPHMPYKNKEAFITRGYKIIKL